MLLLFVVGDVLGAGIYALVGTIGDRVGGAIWAAFLLAIVLAFFIAVAYAELVTKYPQAAGAALYVVRRDRVEHEHYHAPTLLPLLGVGISIAVMFTKEGDVFLRAGLLLLVGVVVWVMNLAALRARGRFSSAELAGVQSPPER